MKIHNTQRITHNRKPLVSVIMPVYNAGEFLVEAIESILTQTVKDFEFLIIEDHSTDNSWEIIRKYQKKDKRIKAFRNKSRIGLVKSLNFLIPKTRGQYIARMDADDISLPARFARQIEYLETHSDIIACGGQEFIIDEKGNIIAEKYFPTDSKECYNKLMNLMVIQPPLLMARGSIFRMLRYDNHIFRNDDITMHFKLLNRGNFGNVDGIIFKYRKVDQSLTHINPKRVYFLALKARVNAILKEDFRPSILNICLAFVETLLVLLIPGRLITPVFEYFRYRKGSTPQKVLPRLAWDE